MSEISQEEKMRRLQASKDKLAAAEKLHIQLQYKLEDIKRQYAEAEKEALALFGTTDTAVIAQQLAEADQRDLAAITLFEQQVSQFASLLTKIEAAMANPALMSALQEELTQMFAATPDTPSPVSPAEPEACPAMAEEI